MKAIDSYQIVSRDWFAVQVASDDHLSEPLSHVSQTGGERQNCHDLTSDGDVKLALRGDSEKPQQLL